MYIYHFFNRCSGSTQQNDWCKDPYWKGNQSFCCRRSLGKSFAERMFIFIITAVHLYHHCNGQRNHLRTLNPKRLRNWTWDLVFQQDFQLSHTSKERTVFFHATLLTIPSYIHFWIFIISWFFQMDSRVYSYLKMNSICAYCDFSIKFIFVRTRVWLCFV